MSNFNLGDVVRLKSGGPAMTIREPSTDAYGRSTGEWYCIWFNDKDEERGGNYPAHTLELYKDEED